MTPANITCKPKIQMSDRISVITATFSAPKLLQRAVESMLAQDNPAWEMIVSPDDGQDYSRLEQIDKRIRVVRTSQSRSGAGAARNRGLALATGTHVGTLDDDDVLAPNFVGEVLKAMSIHSCVTVPTIYQTEAEEFVRVIGYDSNILDIPSFSQQLGSMHVIGRKDQHSSWESCFAQDVLHTCTAIDRSGGKIPIVRSTSYICSIRSESTCAVRRDIDDEYRMLAEHELDGFSVLGSEQTKNLFKYRRMINAAFERRADQGVGYHEFVRNIR